MAGYHYHATHTAGPPEVSKPAWRINEHCTSTNSPDGPSKHTKCIKPRPSHSPNAWSPRPAWSWPSLPNCRGDPRPQFKRQILKKQNASANLQSRKRHRPPDYHLNRLAASPSFLPWRFNTGTFPSGRVPHDSAEFY
jgi:hypothetical protein